jgi:hypothetical protein
LETLVKRDGIHLPIREEEYEGVWFVGVVEEGFLTLSNCP